MIVLSDLDRSGGFAPRSFAAGSAASGTNRVNQRLVARRYEDLDAWHLADQLRQEVFALTETGTASKDFKFRDQIRDAASSSARNIAEGFGRFRPPDFARFMEFSIASTMEVRDLLIEGIERKRFTTSSTKAATTLVRRSLQVSGRLLLYLKRCRHEPTNFLADD